MLRGNNVDAAVCGLQIMAGATKPDALRHY
jgi:hypothetical protein